LIKRLHLANTRCAWRELTRRAEQEEWSYREFLALLISEEVAHRQQTRLNRLVRRARFPFLKTIDDFNFMYQSTVRLSLLGSALAPDFVTEGRCIIFGGKTGPARRISPWRSRIARSRMASTHGVSPPPNSLMPSAASLTYAVMDVSTAIAAYAEERRAQVSARMAAYWLENSRPLSAFFKDAKLRQITPAQVAAYQNNRTEAGRAAKTINGELSVLRQVLKRAKLWYRFDDKYSTLLNRKPPVGRALTPEDQQRLFEIARTRPAWLYAYVGHDARFLLRAPRLRNQRASLAGRRPDQSSLARPPIEDAGRLAIADTEHDMLARAAGALRSRSQAGFRAGRSLCVPVARTQQASRSHETDGIMAHRLAVNPQGGGTPRSALP
jgi:hypothetical protein